jgi:hypothetical protein
MGRHCHTRQESAVFGGICSHLEASNRLIFLVAVFERAVGSASKMRERDNAFLPHLRLALGQQSLGRFDSLFLCADRASISATRANV